MRYLQVFATTVAIAAVMSLSSTVDAGGSSGGYGSGGGYSSSGGSVGGLRARLAAHRASSGSSGGGSYGSRGGSSGGSRGGSSGGSVGGSSGGRVGPLQRLAAHIRSKRASRGGSSGGSAGGSRGGSSGGYLTRSYGSSAGSSGGVSYSSPAISYSTPSVSYAPQTVIHGASAGYESNVIESSYQTYTPMNETIIDGGYSDGGYSDGGYNSGVIMDSGSTIIDGTPIDSGIPVDTSFDSTRYESEKPVLDDDAALLTVAVPNETATVTVNGHPTSSDGTVRQFMSRGLKDGYVYTYVVNVDYDMNGTKKSDSKEIKLRPGDTEQVVFEPPQVDEPSEAETTQTQPAPVTVVKLHVPDDAIVNLAGNDTNGHGSVRTFRTTALAAGQQWTDYTVRVTTQLNGQSVSQERTVNVDAGSTTELNFDFGSDDVAQR